MDTKKFDRMQAIGRKLREIFDRDKTPFAPGCEDYLVRSVEEATRLTMRALDDCPVCLGSGVRITHITGVQTKCRKCHGTGHRQ
jgi:hypothetical protein